MALLARCESVLVTGASGLVGSCLASTLREQWPNIQLLTPSRQELDLSDGKAVHRYWSEHKPEAVFHVAAFVRGLGGNLSAGAQAFVENAALNHNVMMASLTYPPRSFFAAGTVAMYPYPYPSLPLREEFVFEGEPHEGEYFYALAKRALAPYLRALRHGFDCRTVLGLFTNLYGPRDRFDEAAGHVVPSLVKRFVDAEVAGADRLIVWGSPETTRDFAFVEDAVRAAVAVAEGEETECNIASGRETSMQELVAVLQSITGYEGEIVWDSTKPIGIPRRSVDVSRLTALAPSITFRSLEEGIAETVHWYRHHRQRPPLV